MGGTTRPGTEGVTALGGSVAIGGDEVPGDPGAAGRSGVRPLGGGSVAMGGATPPGMEGVTPLAVASRLVAMRSRAMQALWGAPA